jgi:hypothetical protein
MATYLLAAPRGIFAATLNSLAQEILALLITLEASCVPKVLAENQTILTRVARPKTSVAQCRREVLNHFAIASMLMTVNMALKRTHMRFHAPVDVAPVVFAAGPRPANPYQTRDQTICHRTERLSSTKLESLV